MMEIFKILGIALTLIVAVLIVKQTKPELASILLMAGGVVISFYIVDMLEDVFGVFTKILEATHIDNGLFVTLLKIIGIGYLAEFGASICNDSGNSSVALKLQLAGKLTIFVLSIPIITKLIDLLVELIK